MNQDDPPDGPQPRPSRTRTFLKGIVYYDNRRASIDCTVRDMSETGARIVFSTPVIVPDNLELYIPQKQVTLPVRVRRRDEREIGVSFDEQRTEAARSGSGELSQRITKLENEIVVMKRMLKKLAAKVLPNDTDI